MDTLIEIDELTKHFGDFVAVDGISLTVGRGEVLGFLGPNGAGKSTTMKMVTGFLAPTAGSARICGADVVDDTLTAQAKLGYLPEGAPLYPDMDATGLLSFVAEIRGMDRAKARARVAEVVDLVNLEGVMRQPIETLSKGYKRRVGLAIAILDDPDVLILDEPTDGLDPNQKHEVRRLIQSMAEQKAILVSTHILEEVEAVCTRAIIIDRGRVVADGTPADLAARSRRHNIVHLSLVGEAPDVREALAALPTVSAVTPGPDGSGSWSVTPVNGTSIAPEVADVARTKGWQIGELRVEHGRLDDVFRTVTRSETSIPAAPHPGAVASGEGDGTKARETEEVNA